MARRPPNRPADVVVAVVLVLAAISGPAVGYLIRHLEFCCGPTQPTTSVEYSTSAMAEAIGAALLVALGGFVVVALRRARWLWLLMGVLSAIQIVLALVHQHQASTAAVDLTRLDPATAVIFVLYAPTMWPLLVVAVGSVVIVALRRPLGRRGRRHEKVGA